MGKILESLERIKYESDPRRCQAVTAQGQCINVSVPNGTRCIVHGGNKEMDSEKQKSMKNYRLSKWQAQVEQKAESDNIKSLREEIGILRMVLEERLNRCHDAQDLVLQSGPISDMIMKINKVVASCHRLEGSLGQLLDKQAILQFASIIIGIISEELKGQEALINRIAGRITNEIN